MGSQVKHPSSAREKKEEERKDSNYRSILNSRAVQVLPALLAFASSGEVNGDLCPKR